MKKIILLTAFISIALVPVANSAPIGSRVAKLEKQVKTLTAKLNKVTNLRKLTIAQLKGRYDFTSLAMGPWAGANFFGFNLNAHGGVCIFSINKNGIGIFSYTGTKQKLSQDVVFDTGTVNFGAQTVVPPAIIGTATTARRNVKWTGTYTVSGTNRVNIRILTDGGVALPVAVILTGSATRFRDTISIVDNKEAGANGLGIMIKR